MIVVSAIVLPLLALRPTHERARVQVSAAVLGLAVLLAGPAAYAVDTMTTAYSGGDPSAGPQVASTDRDRATGGSSDGGVNGTDGSAPVQPPSGTTPGQPPSGAAPGGDGVPGGSTAGPGDGPDVGLDSATIDYLVATGVLPAGSSPCPARIRQDCPGPDREQPVRDGHGRLQRQRRRPDTGTAPGLRRERRAPVRRRGRDRQGSRRGGQFGDRLRVSSWVSTACTPVAVDSAPSSIYDCAGTAGG